MISFRFSMKNVAILTILLLLSVSVLADDVAVTVYNSNLGVISETRTLKFEKGINRLQFRDVPALIDAASVSFEIASSGRNVSLLEQNYAYDLVSPEQMYARYIDQQIEMLDKEGHLYTGKLLAYGGKAVTLQDGTGRIQILSMSNIAEVDFPVLPEGLITRPTLFWLYRSDYNGSLECKVGYQTAGMGWKAEYVGTLNEDETELSLTGWASITNNSGKTYKDATLKLVAGDINRAPQPRRDFRVERMSLSAVPTDGFAQKQFFEYHLYTLPRKATVANKEIKQVSLFEPATATVNKVYQYQPEVNPKKVRVALKFKNSKSSGLGMPLPAGRIRLFKGDDDGSVILLGEDRIDHTPKDEKLAVTVGYAFDLSAEEKVTDHTRISSSVEERIFEISLRNHKDGGVVIEVEKKLYGFWEIIESSAEYEKKDASTVQFKLTVPANGENVITLKVRYTTR